jgi:hypothetical protein
MLWMTSSRHGWRITLPPTFWTKLPDKPDYVFIVVSLITVIFVCFFYVPFFAQSIPTVQRYLVLILTLLSNLRHNRMYRWHFPVDPVSIPYSNANFHLHRTESDTRRNRLFSSLHILVRVGDMLWRGASLFFSETHPSSPGRIGWWSLIHNEVVMIRLLLLSGLWGRTSNRYIQTKDDTVFIICSVFNGCRIILFLGRHVPHILRQNKLVRVSR